MAKKNTLNDLINLSEKFGFELIDNTYVNARHHIALKDNEGYYYESNYNRLQQNRMPERFHKYNKYTIQNIKLLLKKRLSNFTLVSKVYLDSFQKLVLKDNDGYHYETSLSTLQNGSPLAFDKSNSYTIQNIGLYLSKNQIPLKLIDEVYKNALYKMKFTDDDGYYYDAMWNTLQQKHMPEKFSKSNKYAIENIRTWCRLNNKPFEILDSEYVDATYHKYRWKCLKSDCGESFYTSWCSIYNGVGCGVCHNRQIVNSNCLATINPNLAKEWHPTKNGNLTPYDVSAFSNKSVWWKCANNPKHEWKIKINARNYNGCAYCAGQIASDDYNLLNKNPSLCLEWDYDKNKKVPNEYTPNSGSKVWWKCSDCGHKWSAKICDRNGRSKTGCPECFKSKGEQRIKKILDFHCVQYSREFTFDNLVSDLGNCLRFDFAIFDINNKLICLIEYDGEFHYKKFYKDQDFKTLKHHDDLKNKYCIKNNINLIRIPYWEFNSVELLIKNVLKQNKLI